MVLPRCALQQAKEINFGGLCLLLLQAGGYHVLSQLYQDPDGIEQLLPTDRHRMLARAMQEVRMHPGVV